MFVSLRFRHRQSSMPETPKSQYARPWWKSLPSVARWRVPAFGQFVTTLVILLGLFAGKAAWGAAPAVATPPSVVVTSAPAVAVAPEVRSLFPMGLESGTSARIEIRGKHLDGVYAVWFDAAGMKARVEKIQPDESEEPTAHPRGREAKAEAQSPRQMVLLDATLPSDVSIGKHTLRLIGPGGISKTLSFLVHKDRAVTEAAGDHSSPQKAQPVTLPLLLEGKLAKMGEVDYYSFQVAAGQELVFHGASNVGVKAGGFDALQFHLYVPGGSWFDPHRATEIAFSDEPQLKYRFTQAGPYLLAVSGYLGIGGPDFSYQIRIHSSQYDEAHAEKLQNSVLDDVDQTFARALDPNRSQELWARTVLPPAPGSLTTETASVNAGSGGASGRAGHAADVEAAPARAPGIACVVLPEQEPNDTAAEAQELAIPALVEGTIAHPGDVDSYQFKAQAGEQLAIEVETTRASLPQFTPLLAVLDPHGQELFTNIWRRVGGDNNEWMKTLQPKTLYTVDKDGEYTLQIRDLVSYQYGDQTFAYRLMIRPQVPHVGRIEVKENEVNVAAGQAAKLHLTVNQEEGYRGDVAVEVENLPPGVQALPAAEVEPEAGPQLDQGPKDRYVPRQREVAVLLVAGADAAATRWPAMAHVSVRPVVGGQVGQELTVRDIPLMVTRPARAAKSGVGEQTVGKQTAKQE